jgi:ribonuclease-3
VLAWFENRLDKVNPASTKKDPKSELQELLQGKGLPLPEYQVGKVQGAAHAQTFTVVCQVSLLAEPVIMQGSSRRSAEKAAAEEALKRLALKQ